MTVEFRPAEDGQGVTVIDPIEGHRFPLATEHDIALERETTDRFRDPVDASAACRVRELVLPHVVGVFVRDTDGEMIAECHDFADEDLPPGEYELEIAAPLKLFVRVSGSVRVTSTAVDMRIEFGERERVTLGARSYHERPAATITTTDDPEDVMAAVSTFGSALKTTSPERSFPLLRGHPPAIELGDALDVPEEIEVSDTGVRIEVPPDRPSVYAVATLAHYLGARVIPGEEARLVANDEVLRTLDGPDGLHGAVTDVLQRVFLLDCVVRTEGRFQLDLHERRLLEERIDLPYDRLYDAPIAERITKYFDVPADAVTDLIPTWHLSTHLSPAPESVTFLPYVANALSLVSVGQETPTTPQHSPPPGYESFVRSTASGMESVDRADDQRYVRVPGSDTIARAWVGEGRAVNANDLQSEGVRHRLERESTNDPIDIAIVCNDDRMADEVDDGDLYGDRDELPFDVTVRRDLSRDELRALLAESREFLHYVGHVEHEGFVCSDGTLDAGDLGTVGVDTFLLNGCRSYEQGSTLIDRGSVGGIATHGAIDNTSATAFGRLVAGLLNAGFSLRSALAVAGHRHSIEGRYTVVGDGAIQVAQAENGTPTLLSIDREPDDVEYDVRITTYPTVGLGIGTCYTPYAPNVDRYYLIGGELPSIRLSLPEVVNLLGLERVPTIIDGELRWSTDVDPVDLP